MQHAALARSNRVLHRLNHGAPGMKLHDSGVSARTAHELVGGTWRVDDPAFSPRLEKEDQLVLVPAADLDLQVGVWGGAAIVARRAWGSIVGGGNQLVHWLPIAVRNPAASKVVG